MELNSRDHRWAFVYRVTTAKYHKFLWAFDLHALTVCSRLSVSMRIKAIYVFPCDKTCAAEENVGIWCDDIILTKLILPYRGTFLSYREHWFWCRFFDKQLQSKVDESLWILIGCVRVTIRADLKLEPRWKFSKSRIYGHSVPLCSPQRCGWKPLYYEFLITFSTFETLVRTSKSCRWFIWIYHFVTWQGVTVDTASSRLKKW